MKVYRAKEDITTIVPPVNNDDPRDFALRYYKLKKGDILIPWGSLRHYKVYYLFKGSRKVIMLKRDIRDYFEEI